MVDDLEFGGRATIVDFHAAIADDTCAEVFVGSGDANGEDLAYVAWEGFAFGAEVAWIGSCGGRSESAPGTAGVGVDGNGVARDELDDLAVVDRLCVLQRLVCRIVGIQRHPASFAKEAFGVIPGVAGRRLEDLLAEDPASDGGVAVKVFEEGVVAEDGVVVFGVGAAEDLAHGLFEVVAGREGNAIDLLEGLCRLGAVGGDDDEGEGGCAEECEHAEEYEEDDAAAR